MKWSCQHFNHFYFSSLNYLQSDNILQLAGCTELYAVLGHCSVEKEFPIQPCCGSDSDFKNALGWWSWGMNLAHVHNEGWPKCTNWEVTVFSTAQCHCPWTRQWSRASLLYDPWDQKKELGDRGINWQPSVWNALPLSISGRCLTLQRSNFLTKTSWHTKFTKKKKKMQLRAMGRALDMHRADSNQADL